MSAGPLLDVRGLSRSFRMRRRRIGGPRQAVHAVRDVSLTLDEGQTLGIVGESGSGKSTLARCILRLIEPDQGSVRFRGQELNQLSARDLRTARRHMAMVFQNPYSSLDPTWTVERIVGEPLAVQKTASGTDRRQRVEAVLHEVGLPETALKKHPSEFSGGQRQRIAIARALVTDPAMVVCDEAVASLDVSTRSQVLRLLHQLQQRSGVAYLFISHDLSVVQSVSDHVAVMYLGEIVEFGDRDDVLARPAHPYTKALRAAVPVISRRRTVPRERIVLAGDPPSPLSPPSGCSFHTRCPIAMPICRDVPPEMVLVGPGRMAACHAVADEVRAAATEDPTPAHLREQG